MDQAGVTVTEAALDAIERLRAEHGPLAFFQSGGCCDGSLPICLKEGELPPGPGDTLLGSPGGAPFYVDADQYRRWNRPHLVLDVREGEPQGFSLSPPGAHFVTRPPDAPTARRSEPRASSLPAKRFVDST
ncbi:MAG TPA: DUF779 domain-containing protein [Solirubrobacteraceae bacterium]|nr:DUF779 domain-containing protein [Solirubrobacteraceae bacterium]